MDSSETLEQVACKLNTLRQDPKTRRRFPQDFWDTVIRLAETHTLNEICQKLCLNPVYVKRKIDNVKKAPQFCEVFAALSGTVTIELSTNGLQAKIQGPKECIHYLLPLFRG